MTSNSKEYMDEYKKKNAEKMKEYHREYQRKLYKKMTTPHPDNVEKNEELLTRIFSEAGYERVSDEIKQEFKKIKEEIK